MVMVDCLLDHDEQKTSTSFLVNRENIFVEKGVFSESGLIENMAQTAALRTGWSGMMQAGEIAAFTPKVGVIGAVKNFILHQKPHAGSTLITEVEVITELGNATLVKARVSSENHALAECELTIFLQD